MRTPSPSDHELDQQAVRDTESAIAHSERVITLQHLAIAATERAGRDPTRERTLLATMEGNLGELEAWRAYLLDEPAAEQSGGPIISGHHHGPRPTSRSSLGSARSD
jgi:hypothetical protein